MIGRGSSMPRRAATLPVISMGPERGRRASHLVGKHESILENPRLFQYYPGSRVVCGSVYCSGSLPESDERVLDLHVGIRAVDHRRVLQQHGKEERILAHALDWLSASAGSFWSRPRRL